MAAVRIACCVPFCRRTLRNDEGFQEWICSRHWQATDKKLRRFRSMLIRRGKRRGWTRIRIELEAEYWAKLKAQAIERAAGI